MIEHNGGRRPVLRKAVWNCLLVVAGATLVALAAETFLRVRPPFVWNVWPERQFVPRVGELYAPNEEIRYTNGVDYWVSSRTNSLGFLDREPPSPAAASAACHVALLGDSFVDAKEVAVAEKLQVRLEELASRQLPSSRITTSAFGYSGTGQVQQLAYYDEYVRHLRPKLVVLVFVANDFTNNYPLFNAMNHGDDPEHMRSVSAARSPNGRLTLQSPHPDYRRHRLSLPPGSSSARLVRVVQALEVSALGRWLVLKNPLQLTRGRLFFQARGELLMDDHRYAELLAGWYPTTRVGAVAAFGQDSLSGPLLDALEYTSFALEEFKTRTERDAAEMVVLASHRVRQAEGGGSDEVFERLRDVAAAVNVTVVDQTDYILRQRAAITDAHWAHDGHWNADGHRWAAEALLEHIESRPEICKRG